MEPISCHMMPIAINSLGVDTHIQMSNFKKPGQRLAHAWFNIRQVAYSIILTFVDYQEIETPYDP